MMMDEKQIVATHPEYSSVVTASAGTGKTRTLTGRVLSLLLHGVNHDQILCITFTNAAASEMFERVTNKLSEWHQMDKPQLNIHLSKILGRLPSAREIKRAKSIFLDIMSSSTTLQIKTIHAFCRSIISKFPIETKINPYSEVIDEIKIKEIVRNIFRRFVTVTDPLIQEALDFIYSNIHESCIDDLINSIIPHRFKLKKIQSIDKYKAHLAAIHGISNASIDDIVGGITCNVSELVDMGDYDTIKSFMNMSLEQKIINFDKIKNIFLTSNDVKRSSILKQAEKNSAVESILEQVFQACHKIKSYNMVRNSTLLFVLARQVIAEYERYKEDHKYLDYEDMIEYTKVLLTNSEFRDWVLYKLDTKISHILVDEAQDTSPDQWEVITHIIEDFLSGSSAERSRTVFIVGDSKQSIYSFQGADHEMFNSVTATLLHKMKLSHKKHHYIELMQCYRSGKAILDIIKTVFRNIMPVPNLLCVNERYKSKVQIWPLVLSNKEEHQMWQMPKSPLDASTLARNIASFIKHKIDCKEILPSIGRHVELRDFVILVRHRNAFVNILLSELQASGVLVAGMDRVNLAHHTAVLDILSIAKFVLVPFDDLNLAALLKSPIVGISEYDLYILVIARGKKSLWDYLIEIKGPVYTRLNSFIHLYYEVKCIFHFFHVIIDAMDYRAAMLQAYGVYINDIINEFLSLVLDFDQNSLEDFISWFSSNEIEIKRDTSRLNAVRILTVHGAKGLEAPIVILADTTTVPRAFDNIIVEDDVFMWCPRRSEASNIYLDLQGGIQQRAYQEYLRLLYVAMTRAIDELVICGYGASENGSWYDVISSSGVTSGTYEHQGEVADYTYSSIKHKELPLINLETKYRFCSSIPAQYTSPLENDDHLLYGRVMHKILEDGFISKIFDQNHPLLASLSVPMQKRAERSLELLKESTDIIRLVTEYTIMTEVDIGTHDLRFGRIDLIAINSSEVIIVDFKTDLLVRHMPIDYIEQMRFYFEVLRRIYTQPISTQILWLEEMRFEKILFSQ